MYMEMKDQGPVKDSTKCSRFWENKYNNKTQLPSELTLFPAYKSVSFPKYLYFWEGENLKLLLKDGETHACVHMHTHVAPKT